MTVQPSWSCWTLSILLPRHLSKLPSHKMLRLTDYKHVSTVLCVYILCSSRLGPAGPANWSLPVRLWHCTLWHSWHCERCNEIPAELLYLLSGCPVIVKSLYSVNHKKVAVVRNICDHNFWKSWWILITFTYLETGMNPLCKYAV